MYLKYKYLEIVFEILNIGTLVHHIGILRGRQLLLEICDTFIIPSKHASHQQYTGICFPYHAYQYIGALQDRDKL